MDKTTKENLREQLKKTAIETIYYVALGRAMRRDLVETGMTDANAQTLMSKVATELADKIKEL